MSHDGDILRAANALVTTLNDQKVTELDAERIREIAVGATGGDVPFTVHTYAEESRRLAHLHDDAGQRVLTLELGDDGAWSVAEG
jgi:hypothetical protein